MAEIPTDKATGQGGPASGQGGAETGKTAQAGEQGRVPAERWDPFNTLRQEVDRLFDDFTGSWASGPLAARGRSLLSRGIPAAWIAGGPAVDVIDLENEIQIRADLPGMDESEIDIEMSGNMLTIRGEKKEESETGEKGGRYYLAERRYGSFQRSLQIPDGTDRENCEAKFSKGVLTITFPKTPEAKETAKKITIRSA